MRTKTLLASMALASLAAAQPVSAATRSIDSLPVGAVQSDVAAADRIGADIEDADMLRGKPLLLILLLFGSVAAFILAISGGKSPG